ncbi:hypothetical protein DE146DRAFT_12555 [Phaeosphaeria sp. MPI-PUGE-AT-0046c]|nr:hypothetical protein DE146DRAFT_12555 [Phaeosphaeria sp. MPI-PUGE-AT-0046c]
MYRPLLRTATRRGLAPVPRPHLHTRPYTSKPPTLTTSSAQSAPSHSPRLGRLLSRTPRILHPYIHALSTAPVSHITSFLLLHELTAIVPLLSLAALFHYTHWLPSWFAEGAWVLSGVEKFGRYFRKKGWIGEEERREAGIEVRDHIAHEEEEQGGDKGVMAKIDRMKERIGNVDKEKAWNLGEGGARLVVEVATAYAITKALLVPRIMFSVWATPAFARWTVVPVMAGMGRLFTRGKRGGGALPRSEGRKTP